MAQREMVLAGKPAREICIIVDGINFLNNADLDGRALPPRGAPNPVIAAGGSQLKGKPGDDALYFWKYHVDWRYPARSTLTGPKRLPVARYDYLRGGQLTRCVPQPRVEMKIDAQGDKIMQRFVYRRIGDQESLLATHSVASSADGGAVRWYEFRLDGQRDAKLHQQGSFAPDASYRWLPSASTVNRSSSTFRAQSDTPAASIASRRCSARQTHGFDGCDDTLGRPVAFAVRREAEDRALLVAI